MAVMSGADGRLGPALPRPTRSGGDRRWLAAAMALLVATATVAAFFPVGGAGFLGYDDPHYVTGNEVVQKGLHAAGVRWALTSFLAANWHPLTWISHMLDVSLFGMSPGAHHLVNLGIHVGTSVLLFVLLRGMTGAPWPSFLAAALFAVHPQRVESVAWVSERKDVLSVLLGMVTLAAYLRYVRRPGTGRFLAVAGFLSLGLMAKPMLVTLPFVLLLLDWWPLGRFRAAPCQGRHAGGAAVRLVVEKTPLMLLAAASSAVTYLAQHHGGAIISAGLFPPAARMENVLISYLRYVYTFFHPLDLIPFYVHPRTTLPLLTLAASLAFLVLVTALAVARRGRHPWLLTGWLWYLGVLVPVLGLVQVGLQGMADRYSYLPSVGLCLAVVWEIAALAGPVRRAKAAAVAAGVVAVAALLACTRLQSAYWRDTITLFTRVVTVDPRNFTGFNMLGAEYLLRGEPAKAVPLLRRSVEIWPAYQDGRYNLGLALARLGQTEEAIAQFEANLRVNPRDVETLLNLGRGLAKLRRFPEALRRFDAALALAPDEPSVLFERGLVHVELGQISAAADDFGRVLELDPA